MITLRHSRIALVSLSLLAVGGCMNEQLGGAKHLQPLSYATLQELEDKGMRKEDPLVVRIYKEESTLEVWKPGKDGRYALFKTYDICKWSGELGPKRKEGDRQAPEGFYTVAPGQMNPNSSYYLSFNIGYPNAYDKALGRTGTHLMVHGACSSAGCYAMTDETIAEVYALARDSFRGGQREFQVQAYPFRMTPANMARHAGNPNMPFWKTLKEGSDHFEVTGIPPKVGVCGRDYVFNAKPINPNQTLIANARCPQLDVPDEIEVAVAAKKMRDETAFQVALAEIKMQEQQSSARSDVIMTASLEEQGDAANASDIQADKVLGKQVTEAETSAETKPAEAEFALTGNPALADADAGNGSSVATAFSGVWGKLVGITGGLRSLGNVKGNEATAEPDADADPITTGTTAPKTADDKSASLDSGLEVGLPRLTPATAFVPILVNENPFAVFDYFEEIDGVSVPADLASRERTRAPIR